MARSSRHSPAALVAFVGALTAALAGTSVRADNWPAWRGPLATGVSSETRLPEQWSPTENVAWQTALAGVGVSSPIVWDDKVFVTSQTGSGESRQGPRLGSGSDSAAERSLASDPAHRNVEVQFLIEAFSRADGRPLWRHGVPADGDLPAVHDKHNLASASPVTDGARVYAVFGTGQIVAVDAATGRPVWTRHLGDEYGAWTINWGNGSSPIVHRGALILTALHGDASYLIALDAQTGRTQWKSDKDPGVTSYSTPVVVPAESGEELIVNSSVGVEGYDPATGRLLWQFKEPNRFPIPVPMHHQGVVYLSRGYRSGPFLALRPGGRGDIAKSHVLWHVPTGAPYISSLVYYEGLLYMAGDVGVITCVDAKTGERVWRERLGGVYTASPVAGDGKIYFMSESGETIVLRAGRQAQVLARNTIDGRILASPAIAEGRLFIRTDNRLLAIGR